MKNRGRQQETPNPPLTGTTTLPTHPPPLTPTHRPAQSTDYTRGLSREATSILFKFLPRAYANGPRDLEARERVHSAATIAGRHAVRGRVRLG